MATKISIYHKTIYHFDRAVKLYPHIFRLRPAAHSRTPIETYSFKITPEDLKFYNSELKFDWESGDFQIMIGKNSQELSGTLVNWQK